MVSSRNIRDSLIELLSGAGKDGIHQSLLEKTSGYSKSYLSEILSSMEKEGVIVRKTDAGRSNRVWISTSYPGEVEGLLKVGILKSTEYYHHLIALRKLSNRKNLKISIALFDRSSDIVTGVVEGVLDLGFAPAVSILLSSDASQLCIISEVASGGAFIFENTNSGSGKLASSELSSMSLLSSHFIGEGKEIGVEYFRDPSDAIERFLSGKTKYLSIWEPFATIVSGKNGIKKRVSYDDVLDDMPCCLLICNRKWRKTRTEFLRQLKVEIREATEHPDEAVAKQTLTELSRLLKLPEDVVKRSLRSYRFKYSCPTDDLFRIVKNIGISISASLVEEMVGVG